MFRCSAKTCDTLIDKKGYCPICRKAYQQQWAKKNPGYYIDKKKEWEAKNPERHAVNEKRKYELRKAREGRKDKIVLTPEERKERKRQHWHKLDPEKRLARRMVRQAIKDRRLVRGPCIVCGKIDYTEAHHTDYAKPLDVQWLCYEHHLEAHGKTLRKIGLFDQ
jgi:hypothetical protein